MGWRGCTFKSLDNADSNPWRERKFEKGKESENRKKEVIKGEKLKRGRGGKKGGGKERKCYRGTCS